MNYLKFVSAVSKQRCQHKLNNPLTRDRTDKARILRERAETVIPKDPTHSALPQSNGTDMACIYLHVWHAQICNQVINAEEIYGNYDLINVCRTFFRLNNFCRFII